MNRGILFFLLLIFIISTSFGQLIFFDIWQDDNALIFKIQNPQEQAGVFGSGPMGLGAYKYVAFPYILISHLFGINIQIFYLVGITLYLISALSVFLLSRTLFKNNFHAVSSSLIFASGYIGSESVARLFNSIQTSLSISFACLLFYFLSNFSKNSKLIFYFFALFFYYISFEIAYVRVQYLVLPTVIYYIFFVIKGIKVKNRLFKLLGLLPFLFIYFRFYLLNPDIRTNLVSEYIKSLLTGNFEYLFSFFSTIGYLVFPDILQINIISLVKFFSFDFNNRLLLIEVLLLLLVLIVSKFLLKKTLLITFFSFIWFYIYWNFFVNSSFAIKPLDQAQSVNLLSNFIGGIVLICFFYWIASLSNLYQKKLLFFLYSWVISNILIFSIYLPFNPLESTSRYVTHSFPPLAIIISSILYDLKSKGRNWSRFLLVFFVAGGLSILSFNYQRGILKDRVKPIKSFYNQIKTHIPFLEKNSVIFFQVSEDSKSKKQFNDFFSVGSMPDSTAIAIRYKVDRNDIFQTLNFYELIKHLNKNDTSLNKIYSIYYSSDRIIDKSEILREIIKGNNTFDIGRYLLSTSNNKITISNVNIPSYPLVLKFDARADMKNLLNSSNCSNEYTNDLIKDILLYKASLDRNKILTKIITDSSEINYSHSNLNDSNNESVWRGNRGYWIENHKENITIFFESEIEINKLIWHNAFSNTTPTKYIVFKSDDGSNWLEVKKFENTYGRQQGRIVDELPVLKTKFLKVEIHDTLDSDSPAISEIDFSNFKGDIPSQQIIDKFFSKSNHCINVEMYSFLYNLFQDKGIYTNIYLKDSINSSQEVKVLQRIRIDGQFHSYATKIQVNGSFIDRISIEPIFPLNIDVKDIKIEFLDI